MGSQKSDTVNQILIHATQLPTTLNLIFSYCILYGLVMQAYWFLKQSSLVVNSCVKCNYYSLK